MSGKFEKAVGEQVARLRKEKELTQDQLAEKLGVAPETISRLERGISMPSLKTFENISRSLNVPLKDIFDFEYSYEPKRRAGDRELERVVNFLRHKKAEKIAIGFRILKSVFRALKM